MTPPRPPRDRTVAALALVELAHQVSSGTVSLPRDGVGPTRVDGRAVVPAAVHAVICGWHVATRWEPVEGQPAVKECHGCGLLRLVDETGREPTGPADEEALAEVRTLRAR